MQKFILIFILQTISWIINCTEYDPSNCFQKLNIYVEQETIQKEVANLIEISKIKKVDNKCLYFLLKNGYYEEATDLYQNAFLNITDKAEKDKFNDGIRIVNQQIKRNFEHFTTNFHSSRSEPQLVQPAIQWAQSNSSIFIQSKLGLRMDSPACLTCRTVSIELTENYFNFTSFGIYSHMPVNFNLYLEFEQPIDTEKSIYDKEGVVGTLAFEFVKKEEGIWRKPALNIKEKIPIWWDVRDKNKKIMEQWSEMLEEDQYEIERKQKEERRQIREQKKKQKQEKRKAKKQKQQEAKEEDKNI